MVYIFENSDKESLELYNDSMPYLSSQRREKAMRCKFLSDKINSCLAYLLLRYALITEYSISESPVFEYIENEKPVLRDYPEIHFNLSHCKNSAVCIVSDNNTAVDISDIRRVNPSVIRRVCSVEEQELLNKSDDIARDFIKLWTRKECLAKLSGKGMRHDMSQLTDAVPEMQNVHTLNGERYILSYYTYSGETDIVKLNIDDIFSILRGK